MKTQPLRFVVMAGIVSISLVTLAVLVIAFYPEAGLRNLILLVGSAFGLVLFNWIVRRPALGAALIILVVPFERISTQVRLGPVGISLKMVTLVTLLVVAATFFSIFVGARKVSKRLISTMAIPLLILAAGLTSSIFASREPFVSLESWSYHIFLMAFLFLIPHILQTEKDFLLAFKAVAVASLVMCFYGLYQLLALRFSIPDPFVTRGLAVPLEEVFGIAKIASFQANPNPFAGYLVSTFFILLTILLYRFKTHRKIGLYVLAFLMVLVSFLLTMSRSATLGMICGALMLLAVTRGGTKFGRLDWNIIFLSAWLLVTIASIALFFTSQGQTIINQLLSQTRYAQASTDYHLEFARGAIEMFKDRPILGWGINQFRPVYLSDYTIYPWLTGANTHSMYLTILSETGLVGLFPHLMLIIFFASAIYKGFRTAKRGTFQFFILTGLTAGYISILTGNIFYDYYFNEFVWVYFGLLLAAIQYSQRQKNAALRVLAA